MRIPCEIIRNPKFKQKNNPQKKRGKFIPLEPVLQEDEAIVVGRDCLGLRDCFACDLCGLLCPELCITRHQQTDQIQIDLDYCKGCGICAFVCPKGAIRMVLEEGI
jgi:2-oxoacid:acceptor oxidoreductase delta subunit (pyruvate/2-ketoisovalerate family)